MPAHVSICSWSRIVWISSALALLLVPASGKAEAPSRPSLCLMIESAALANGLPLDFFTRVIWRESRFDPRAIGPQTSGGERAEGIAQFMPKIAAERLLQNPFDPVKALPQAAAFLRELRDRFGNLGLAAAAYNAGPKRIQDWLAGSRALPGETRRYVYAVTGRAADDWARAEPGEIKGPTRCDEVLAKLNVPPNAFAYQLERRITEAKSKLWSVELAAGFSREGVLSAYARAMGRLKQAIGEHDPIITSSVLRSRGASTLYQARISTDGRSEADALCSRIRAAGGACLVTRTAQLESRQ